MKRIVLFLLALSATVGCNSGFRHADLVNTRIGNGGEGLEATFLYPGVTYPFGMVQFTPTFKEPEIGFVPFQLSGVGCYCLGQFPMLPQNGRITSSPCHMCNWKTNITEQEGRAGYYECLVDGSIRTFLSVTERTGMAIMNPQKGCEAISVLIGTGFCISNGEFGFGEGRINEDGSIECHAVAHDFCSAADTPFDIYYYAEFDREPDEVGTWIEGSLFPDETYVDVQEGGLYLTFNTVRPLKYKFAMSFVSMENAKANLRAENRGWNFSRISRRNRAAWEKYLSMVDVEGSNPERVEQFYTHLYHGLIHPCLCNDVNGEYMGSDFKVHKVEKGHKAYHMFSNWDTYRSQIQLVAMLAPDVASDIVRSHMNFAIQCGGGLPRWSMANFETNVMQGDPGSLICTNAYAFGARDFDFEKLAAIMYRAAEDSTLMTQVFPARPNLGDVLKYGYTVPSMTLEYNIADYGIAQFALNACRDTSKYEEYIERSRAWRTLVNPSSRWIQGRNHDGSWRNWDAAWNEFQEGTHTQYHWMVPHDIDKLVELTGGVEASEARLDTLFTELKGLYDSEYFAACNEPCFCVPWSYNYCGRPDKTCRTVNRILTEVYSTGLDGVPGNDDLGAMGSWYTFACSGIFPYKPGVGGFALHTPIFEKITYHLPCGDFVIEGGSEDQRWHNDISLDGIPVEKNWIDFDDIKNGATLRFK